MAPALALALGGLLPLMLASRSWFAQKLASFGLSRTQLFWAQGLGFSLALAFHLSGGFLGGLLAVITGVELAFPKMLLVSCWRG